MGFFHGPREHRYRNRWNVAKTPDARRDASTRPRAIAYNGGMGQDGLIKELLRVFFVDFLRLFVPEVLAYLDVDSIAFQDKEIFTEVTAGTRHVADLVVKARIRGEGACFLIHIESQATPQSDFAKRMFRYFARLYEKHDLPVYPIALFTFGRPMRREPDTFTVRLPDTEVLRFQFKTIQLNQLNWRDYLNDPNPAAAALMARMNIAPEDRPRAKLECLRMIVTLKLDPARMKLLSSIVDTLLPLDEREEAEFDRTLEEAGFAEKEKVMELTTSWMEKGLRLGREEGREEGREAALDITLQFLARQVGALSPEQARRVGALSLGDLRRLGAALVEFHNGADLDAWLASG